MLGRTFLSGEDQPGNDRVVLLSHVLWETRFGSDAAMLGMDILLEGEPHTVIGVLPKGGPFDPAAAQIWKPLAFEPSNMTRDFRWLGATARLKPDLTLAKAQAASHVIDALRRRRPRSADNRCCGRGALRSRRAGVFPAGPANHKSGPKGNAAVSMKLLFVTRGPQSDPPPLQA